MPLHVVVHRNSASLRISHLATFLSVVRHVLCTLFFTCAFRLISHRSCDVQLQSLCDTLLVLYCCYPNVDALDGGGVGTLARRIMLCRFSKTSTTFRSGVGPAFCT